MRRIIPLALAALLMVSAPGALLAGPALAAGDAALVDCATHNRLTAHYTVAELRHALRTMSADVKEYTSCGDVIQRALDAELVGLHAGGSGGSGGGSFLPAPVIVVLVVILLGGAGYGAVLLRRRGPADEPGQEPPVPGPGQ